MPMDPLFPLAASVITHPLDVTHRVALTAAAAVIPGPLALAPALVALQRLRGIPTTHGDPTPPPPVDVGPPLIMVPKVVGSTLSAAQQTLGGVKLKSTVHHNVSTDKEKDIVLMQQPHSDPEKLVPEGSVVRLWVGNGPKPVPADPLGDELDAHLKPLGDKIDAMGTKIDGLGPKIDGLGTTLTEILAAIKANNPDSSGGPGKAPKVVTP